MIKSIAMKNCGTYSVDGILIQDCKKINFVYGHNGSGKSTISNYLMNPEDRKYSSCSIVWENSKNEVLVYNKQFRDRHFKEDIDGVFTLGEATIETQEELKNLKSKKDFLESEIGKRESTLGTLRNVEQEETSRFKNEIWDKLLKNNESDFRDAFTGFRNNKDTFKDEVLRRYKIKSSEVIQDRESLKKRADTIFGTKPQYRTPLSFDASALISAMNDIEKDSIWSKVVIGNKDVRISALILALNNADWVNQGRSFIQNGDVCPFCQQRTISDNLRDQLNSFFSGEYDADITYIKEKTQAYRDISRQVIEKFELALSNVETEFVENTKIQSINSEKEAFTSIVANNFSRMLAKEKEASNKISLTQTSSHLLSFNKFIAEINESIDEHNKIVANFQKERRSLIDSIWSYLLAENSNLITYHQEKLENNRKGQKGIQDSIENGKKELAKVEIR